MSGMEQHLASDGRDLDPRLADVAGLAAGQQADPSGPDRPMPGAGRPVWERVPSDRDPGAAATYYDQPVVKAPPWGRPVAAYLVTGGVAGTAAALAAAVDVFGTPQQQDLARLARPLAAAAATASAGLLVADLGRRDRFLHMVRVVRPTSVMNVGGYLLSATTGAAVVAAALHGRSGVPGRLGRAAGLAAGVCGVPLAGYTGVLLAATAIPAWNVGTRTLPPLFLASGAATTGSLLRLAPLAGPAGATATLVTATAQVGELAAEAAHDRLLATRPRVKRAQESRAGWRAGRYLTLASLVLGLLAPRGGRWVRVAGGLLGVLGSVLTKTAVFSAGVASAADPLAVPESGRSQR